MSYCRFSSENFYCDAYVYASVNGGFVTHIAARRPPPGAPPDPWVVYHETKSSDAADAAHAARDTWAKQNPPVDINHPEAGAYFHHATARECAENLIRLRGEGFNIPQYAIDSLLAEEDEKC